MDLSESSFSNNYNGLLRRHPCFKTESTCRELLERNYDVTVRAKNLQLLMTEKHQTKNSQNPSFMKEKQILSTMTR